MEQSLFVVALQLTHPGLYRLALRQIMSAVVSEQYLRVLAPGGIQHYQCVLVALALQHVLQLLLADGLHAAVLEQVLHLRLGLL